MNGFSRQVTAGPHHIKSFIMTDNISYDLLLGNINLSFLSISTKATLILKKLD